MRKIEENMLHAIAERKNFKRDNTEVTVLENGGNPHQCILVHLHGNQIACYWPFRDRLHIYDGGWESVTTKSRLNAILSMLTEGYGIVQRDWQWYIAGPGKDSKTADVEWQGREHFLNGHRE